MQCAATKPFGRWTTPSPGVQGAMDQTPYRIIRGSAPRVTAKRRSKITRACMWRMETHMSWEKAFDTDRLRPNVNLRSNFFLFFVFRSVLVSLVFGVVGTSREGASNY